MGMSPRNADLNIPNVNPNPNPNTNLQPNPNPYPDNKPQPNPNPNFTNWEVAKEVYVLVVLLTPK